MLRLRSSTGRVPVGAEVIEEEKEEGRLGKKRVYSELGL
jgi:hypothetical protein